MVVFGSQQRRGPPPRSAARARQAGSVVLPRCHKAGGLRHPCSYIHQFKAAAAAAVVAAGNPLERQRVKGQAYQRCFSLWVRTLDVMQLEKAPGRQKADRAPGRQKADWGQGGSLHPRSSNLPSPSTAVSATVSSHHGSRSCLHSETFQCYDSSYSRLPNFGRLHASGVATCPPTALSSEGPLPRFFCFSRPEARRVAGDRSAAPSTDPWPERALATASPTRVAAPSRLPRASAQLELARHTGRAWSKRPPPLPARSFPRRRPSIPSPSCPLP